MKRDTITSIEITDSHIKLLQSKKLRGRTVLCGCDIRSIASQGDEDIGRVLVDMIGSKNISGDDVVFSIPRRFAFLKHMRLPSNNDSEINKMIALQLVNKIPYSQEEICFKPYVLEKEKSGYTKLLVLIVHKEIVERYLSLFENVGISLSHVTLSSLGLANWFSFQEIKIKKKTPGAVILLNIDIHHSEICFCVGGKLVYSRSFNYGSKDLNSEKVDEIIEQVKVSINTYNKENMGEDVSCIKILSDLMEVTALRDRLASDLKLEVDVVSPFEKVLCQKNLNMTGIKNFTGVSLTVGLGLLLSGLDNLINFTPQEVHESKAGKKRKGQWFKFFGLLILCFICSVSVFGFDLYQKNAVFKQLKEALRVVEPKVELAISKEETVKVLDKEFKNRIFVPDLINELIKQTPEDISYRSLYLTEGGKFTIQGYSKTSASVNKLRERLVRSKLFEEVDLQFATKRRFRKVEITDFKIITSLNEMDIE